MSPMRWTAGSLPLALALVLGGVASTTGQSSSPGPSASAGPAASVGPVASAGPAAGPDAAIDCEAALPAAVITAAIGQEVVSSGGSAFPNLGLGDDLDCGWSLADGTVVHLAVALDTTLFPLSYADKYGPANGGSAVSGVPGPAFTALLGGHRYLAWTARNGPLVRVTHVLDLTGPQGETDDLPSLIALATAHVMDEVGVDPVCTARLAVDAIASESLTADDGTFRCAYVLGGGRGLLLTLDRRPKEHLPNCCARVKSLDGGYAQQGLGRVPPWIVEWLLVPGDPATVARLENLPDATRLTGRKALVALAAQVAP